MTHQPTTEDRGFLSENVLQWLNAWFAGKGRTAPQNATSSADIDYFEAGWLTSMEVVEFVTQIEEHFGMQFSEDDLQDARFVTIGGLAELIIERSAQNADSDFLTGSLSR
jgi:acyl carrier protein